MAAITPKDKLFFAEAVKGYTVKVMVDTLAHQMPRTVFRATKKGFYHRGSNKEGSILFDTDFSRNNFKPYRCTEEIVFSINMKHFQKMLRNVKKKDSILLFIEKKHQDRLCIAIRPCGSTSGQNGRLETVYVTITRDEQMEPPVALPEVWIDPSTKQKYQIYGYPMVVDANEFQKVKKLMTVGKTIAVEMQANNYISFYSNSGELYGSKVEFGEILDNPEDIDDEDSSSEVDDSEEDDEYYSEEDDEDDEDEEDEDEEDDEDDNDEEDEDEDEDDEDEEIKGWYEASFPMNIFNVLMKLPGLCTQMQFFAPRDSRFPLKVRVQAGILGPMTIYIKDTIQIAYEQTQREEERRKKEENAPKTATKKKK